MIGVNEVVTLVLSLFVLLGIRLMSSPKTAVKGNMLGVGSILVAIVYVLIYNKIIDMYLIWIAIAIGGSIGYYLAVSVTMLQIPQMVAFFNGMGGGAAAIIAFITIFEGYLAVDYFHLTTSIIALVIGCITFSGSIVAVLKLDRRISQKSITLPGHSTLNMASIVAVAVLFVLALIPSIIHSGAYIALILVMTAISLFYGMLFAIRVGGADMPITISLLISCSGIAGSVCGLAIGNVLLVAVAAIVGASGIILTGIMCKAMNRSLLDILSGKTTVSTTGTKAAASPKVSKKEAKKVADKPRDPIQDAAAKLAAAKKVIIIPGYGMALAQAQFEVKKLMDTLEEQGKDVKFAIHPVAGRMPGHMNVLLAEVEIPYDKLCEMDQINPEFDETDVALVIGACDVVNPAANTHEGTPIYGMPVLAADKAKDILVFNLDANPGYSGVDNTLYDQENTSLLLGDAKETLAKLVLKLAKG